MEKRFSDRSFIGALDQDQTTSRGLTRWVEDEKTQERRKEELDVGQRKRKFKLS